jgi:hypothetical protein
LLFSNIRHPNNLVLPHSTRGFDFRNVPGVLAYERTCNRRIDGNLADLDVGFVVTDDLVDVSS